MLSIERVIKGTLSMLVYLLVCKCQVGDEQEGGEVGQEGRGGHEGEERGQGGRDGQGGEERGHRERGGKEGE